MIKTVRIALIGALMASGTAMPAFAQQHRAPAAHGPAPHAPAAHGPKRPAFHDVSVSRGHKFRKGQRLAANQRRYVVNDWSNRGLRQPPRGYQWVREDNNTGDYILVAAATGIIASILAQ